jgi:hypothetical protein
VKDVTYDTSVACTLGGAVVLNAHAALVFATRALIVVGSALEGVDVE